MPDERLIHRACGHSEKVTALTDFERLVWLGYKLASDDFGVMRFSPTPLQAAALWLENRPEKVVQRALDRVLEVGLIRVFDHQGRPFCYQHDWQTWQKITHPRQTKQPRPPGDDFDLNTQWLFQHHPKGAKLTSWQHPDERPKAGKIPGKHPDDSRNPPGKLPEDSRPVFVDVGSDRVGVRDRGRGEAAAPPSRGIGSGVMAGALPREHLRHAFCGRVCVPDFLHAQFQRQIGGDPADADSTLRALYNQVLAGIADDQPIGDRPTDFWQKHFTAAYPSGAPASERRAVTRKPSHTPADVNKYAGITLGLDAEE
jgi:hypothetical protein